MSVHRYPPHTLAGDYLRAGAGFGLTIVTLLTFAPPLVISLVFALFAGLCVFFLIRTVDRHRTVVSLGADGISLSGGWQPAKLNWADLKSLRLDYYSVKRDKRDGWMQLTVASEIGSPIKIDSRIEDFLLILREAARAAKTNQVVLNRITLSNLSALRITGD